MIRLQTVIPTTLLVLVAGIALASADERFRLKGKHSVRGDFQSEVVLSPKGNSISVQRRVRWADGSVSTYSGTLPKTADGLRGQLSLSVGMTGSLRGETSGSIGWAFRPGSRCAPSTREGGATRSDARGGRVTSTETTTQPASAKTKKPRGLKGRLIGLAKSEAERALKKGASLEADLGGFAHVGVRTKVERISTAKLSAAQKAALLQGPSVWVAIEVEGGARVGTSTSVELGGASLSLGVRAGASLRYRIVERYPLSPGLSVGDRVRELASVARDAYSLPLSASEARALGLGSSRTLEGTWNVLFSGNIALGEPLEGRVSLGGTYQIRDRFQLVVERLAGNRVRLRLTRTKTRSTSVAAKAVLGVAVRDRLVDLAPSASFVAKPVGKAIEKALRVELELSTRSHKERELQWVYDVDLGRSAQAKAYQRAIRGDWRGLEAAGAHRVLRSVGLERERFSKIALGLGKLASFERSKRTTRTAKRIEDATGVREERSASVERGKSSSWFGKEEEHSLSAAGFWTLRRNSRELSIRVRYQSRDERTSQREFFQMRGALIASGFRDAMTLRRTSKKTRCALEVDLSQAVLNRIQRASRERVLREYAIAVHQIQGKAQLWLDPAKRSTVRTRKRTRAGSRIRVYAYPTQRRNLRRAEAFADALAAFSRAKSQEAREQTFLTRLRRLEADRARL
ncbi:MAG: hypothetical protein JKY65_14675 [Planctomycetes bacterium]|nr:hypothetical protein [Planctomycetota bacterium]